MNNTLQQFQHEEFGSVRVIKIEGEPWFVGKDVADALGYRNHSKALNDHVDAEDKLNNESLSSLGQRGGWIISESGLYSLILSSKLPTAKKFKRWVTSEILPSIRKHGAYITNDLLDDLLHNPDLASKLLQALQTEREKNTDLEIRLATQAPKVRYCDVILQCKNAIPVTLIAKDYGMSAVAFNRLLHDLGIQHKIGGAWVLYQKYAGQGYTQSNTYYTGNGYAVLHTCWTQKGRLFLYDALAYYDLLPRIEALATIH